MHRWGPGGAGGGYLGPRARPAISIRARPNVYKVEGYCSVFVYYLR